MLVFCCLFPSSSSSFFSFSSSSSSSFFFSLFSFSFFFLSSLQPPLSPHPLYSSFISNTLFLWFLLTSFLLTSHLAKSFHLSNLVGIKGWRFSCWTHFISVSRQPVFGWSPSKDDPSIRVSIKVVFIWEWVILRHTGKDTEK